MRYEMLISRRYLFSKKSHNAINIVSMIAVIGVSVATMAMVIVMSVFNGFQGLVADLFTGFDPELRITPSKGSSFSLDDDKIKQLASSCMEMENPSFILMFWNIAYLVFCYAIR